MNEKNPKVSVLMPVFNGLPYLQDAVESILSQTFGDFEFIIIDDGSSDGTYEALQGYGLKDPRVKLFKNDKKRGIVYSLNRGLKECRGDYIVRMDADDISVKNRIEEQISVMEGDRNICVLGTAVSYIDALGKDLGLIRHCALGGANLMQTPLLHSTTMIRRECLANNGFEYKEKYRFAEDYFLWLQLSRIGKISACQP